jgi:cell division protease FtsH
MVTRFGMSDLGPVALEGDQQPVFLGNEQFNRAEYSQDIANKIDLQIRFIIDLCYQQAKQIIEDKRPLIDHLVDLLIDQETIEGDRFREIISEFKLDKPVLVKS